MTPVLHGVAEAADALRSATYAVALTGAGLSAESGIPTYRGTDGVWTKFGEPTIDGWELFNRDPKAWWEAATDAGQGRTEFTRALDTATPNAGHVAMFELEVRGYLKHVVTQNVDDLHRQAGSRHVTEIHGNRAWARCTNCGQREPLEQVKLDRLPPLCLYCGGYLKNDIVMFGEPIPEDALRESYRQAVAADVFMLVGTSAVVYPAADLPIQAKRRGAKLIEINPAESDLSFLADVVIRATAGQALPEIVEALGERDPG